jgi:hypothetical protein
VLGEALDDTAYAVRRQAALGIWDREVGYYPMPERLIMQVTESMWKENGDSWRRRARQLPR